MNQQMRKGQRLFVLFLIGSLFLNYPLLSIFSQEGFIVGIPILYIYIFLAWAALIGIAVVVVE